LLEANSGLPPMATIMRASKFKLDLAAKGPRWAETRALGRVDVAAVAAAAAPSGGQLECHQRVQLDWGPKSIGPAARESSISAASANAGGELDRAANSAASE